MTPAPCPLLTRDNYYSRENTAISNSKVSDFLKSPSYFHRKHILHEFKRNETPPMKVGSIMDDILSLMPTPYVKKVLKKEDPDEYERQQDIDDNLLVTPALWDEAHARAKAVSESDAYCSYAKDTRFQVPLQGVYQDMSICGMADVISETPTTVYIDDFKACSGVKVKSLAKWYWNCVDMGYFRQLGAYRFLYRLMNPKDTRPVVCRHLLSVKEDTNYYTALAIVMDDELIDIGESQFLSAVSRIKLAMIGNKWNDEPVSWETAPVMSSSFGSKIVEYADDTEWAD